MDRKRLAILAGNVAGICVVALSYHLTQSVALCAALMAVVNGGVWWVCRDGVDSHANTSTHSDASAHCYQIPIPIPIPNTCSKKSNSPGGADY